MREWFTIGNQIYSKYLSKKNERNLHNIIEYISNIRFWKKMRKNGNILIYSRIWFLIHNRFESDFQIFLSIYFE